MTIPATLASLSVPVAGLVPYPGNPRRGNIDTIVESLKVNGQYRPIVVRKGSNEVLAGNHTLAAARALGWTEIAATFVDVDDEHAARIVLIDNRANDLAGYDDQALIELLHELPSFEGTGYDAQTLAELEAALEQANGPARRTDPDHVPTVKGKPRSAEGDVWLLGPHRLAVGDGTDPAVVEKAVGAGVADCYLTDPPYNVAYVGKTADALTIDNDAMSGAAFDDFLTGLFTAAIGHVKQGGPAYIFHADPDNDVAFRESFTRAGWDLKQVLVWVKDVMVIGRQDHHWQHEPILYGWRPGAAHAWYGGRTLTTLLRDDQPNPAELSKAQLVALVAEAFDHTTAIRHPRPKRNAEHPTMKPVGLLERILDRSTRLGDLVLDTCAGSGSTLIACHGTSRRAALVELDPHYADVIARRYQEHTGTLPVLEATGEAHDFTAA